MVGHQAPSQQTDLRISQILPQQPQISMTILISGESLAPVYASLGHVASNSGQQTSASSRHGGHSTLLVKKVAQFRLSPFTNLYYYRARYYDPQIGRFISDDPIQFKGGMNFYAYVHNTATNRTDSLGLCDGCFEPNFLQKLEITALKYYAQKTGYTFGIGAGLSGGIGYVIGASGAISGQLVVSPDGKAALVYTGGSNTTPFSPYTVGLTHGTGILAGVQVSVSNAKTPSDLAGNSVDAGGGYGSGAGIGTDVSVGNGGVVQWNATLGLGAGGWGGAGIYQQTKVIPACEE